MFVQIAPHVKVFLTREQVAFVEKYQHTESFTDRSLSPEEARLAQVLGDKSIFVRKKLADGFQYQLNRAIRGII